MPLCTHCAQWCEQCVRYDQPLSPGESASGNLDAQTVQRNPCDYTFTENVMASTFLEVLIRMVRCRRHKLTGTAARLASCGAELAAEGSQPAGLVVPAARQQNLDPTND